MKISAGATVTETVTEAGLTEVGALCARQELNLRPAGSKADQVEICNSLYIVPRFIVSFQCIKSIPYLRVYSIRFSSFDLFLAQN